ncbi:MAG: ABC transporter ATP-binding protein [Lachnospiraceae bacterium]|nr:ABC transporter ATP-binding protein [Lachnospiraceae bacterium]
MEILKIENVYKEYGNESNKVVALRDVNISINKGEFVAIVGFSGSGKTTLLNMMGALDRPSKGKIIISSKNIEQMTEDERVLFRRRNIGFVFQSYNLISDLTAYENIVLPIQADGEKVNNQYLKDIVHILGIENKLDCLPNEMSGGQQQRIAIARALITKPAIILADEPTGNLDSKSSLEVMNLLRGTCKKYGQTVVVITHNDSLAQLADRIIRIEDGKIVRC